MPAQIPAIWRPCARLTDWVKRRTDRASATPKFSGRPQASRVFANIPSEAQSTGRSRQKGDKKWLALNGLEQWQAAAMMAGEATSPVGSPDRAALLVQRSRRARDARMCKQQLLQLGLLTHSVLAQSGLAHSVRQRRACWLNAQRRVATSVISRAPSRGARGRRALCMGRLPTLPRNGLAQTGLAQGRLVQRRTRARFARTAAGWIVATSHTAR